MSEKSINSDHGEQRYHFRQELECEEFIFRGKRKYLVHDIKNDISYELGEKNLALAKLFDGKRTLAQIQSHAEIEFKSKLNISKLELFKNRLAQLGILSMDGVSGGLKRDPATGITYGPLKKVLLINLLKMDPQRGLDFLYQFTPWLCSKFFHILLMAISSLFLLLLFSHWRVFFYDTLEIYTKSWSWLIWHYPVILTSIAIHELGHALSCRYYKVKVTDFGIGVYTLLATGWVRPEQKAWSALLPKQRAITILMGPIASIYYASIGIAIWYSSDPNTLLHSIGVVMIVSSSLSLIPTLLPIFNGDTYLALTEFFNQPRLRQRAFKYCRQYMTGKTIENDGNAKLYWTVFIVTGVGWLIAWVWVLLLIQKLLSLYMEI